MRPARPDVQFYSEAGGTSLTYNLPFLFELFVGQNGQ